MHEVAIEHRGETIVAHYRAPAGADSTTPVAAVLVMCGADVFKEDRGWAHEMCIDNGMAALVMDGPGTGQNPFPWSPDSVTAWEAAIDWLMARPEVDATRVGAFGISRGGYSVMQLAGTAPEKVKAIVASAGHPFGYRMTEQELDELVAARNLRATWRFGAPDDPPSFPQWSREREQETFETWALSELGILDDITMPVLMINGKHALARRQHLLHARAWTGDRQGGPHLRRRRPLRVSPLRRLGTGELPMARREAQRMTAQAR